MMVALSTTRYAADELAGTPIPNLPSCLRCIIARLVGLRRSLRRLAPDESGVQPRRAFCAAGCNARFLLGRRPRVPERTLRACARAPGTCNTKKRSAEYP